MLSCIKHISYYLITLFINNYKWSSKTDVPCYILLMFFCFRVVKVHILFQKIYFNLVSFKKHLILYLKWIDLVSWNKVASEARQLVWNRVGLKGYVLLKEGMFSLFNCLEPETGYTISLSARWRSCFFELGALKECEGWDDGKFKKKNRILYGKWNGSGSWNIVISWIKKHSEMHDFCLGLGNIFPLCPPSPRGLNQPGSFSVLFKNYTFCAIPLPTQCVPWFFL